MSMLGQLARAPATSARGSIPGRSAELAESVLASFESALAPSALLRSVRADVHNEDGIGLYKEHRAHVALKPGILRLIRTSP